MWDGKKKINTLVYTLFINIQFLSMTSRYISLLCTFHSIKKKNKLILFGNVFVVLRMSYEPIKQNLVYLI